MKNTTSIQLFLFIRMAEGVACVHGNGSFRTILTKLQRVDLQDGLAKLLYRHGQSLKSGSLHEEILKLAATRSDC